MPSRFVFKLSAAALAVAAFSNLATAQNTLSASGAENGRLWFVELIGKPAADGATVTAVQSEQARFRAAARAAGVSFVERRSYNTLFNGFSIDVSARDRAKIAKMPGVRAMYPVELIQAPDPIAASGSAPDLATAIAMTGAKIAQNSLGLTGAGVKVGIIDSGVDVDHPAFGGTGTRGTTAFPSARIVTGWDFVGDNFNAAGTTVGELTPVPDADPRDCGAAGASPTPGSSFSGGHGTHVAGIVGANGGGLVGVAPGVSLAAYRVFGCYGSTTAEVMVAAMERALADGMQVINQSIGSSRQWPQYPTAQAAARLAKKGVVVVASIGNSGPGAGAPDALYAAGAPGVGDGVIGVASYDNTHVTQTALVVNSVSHGFSPSSGGTAAVPTSGSSPIVRTGTTTTTNDGCNAFSAGSLTGQVALIRRGTCGFYNKAINAQNAGAIGVVLYNNAAGILTPNVAVPAGSPAGTPTVGIPVVMITQTSGATVDAAIQAGPQTVTWTTQLASTAQATGGLISGFSSFGLAADLSFKPNLGAPGGQIYSSLPLEQGSGGSLSGTSMSSPHVAGGAALVLQAVPGAALGRAGKVGGGVLSGGGATTPPDANMLTRLMNTAKPKNWSGNPGLGFLDHTHRQGAGMLDVVAAVQTQQYAVPASITTGESQGGPKTQRITVRNDSSSPVSYTMGHTAALSTGPNVPNGAATAWVTNGVQSAPATVSFSSGTVNVPAKGMATVDVTITANGAQTNQSLYGGYITLTPTGAGTALLVPYAGFFGDYQSLLHLRPSASGFPWVASLAAGTFSRCGTGTTPACSFTMAGGNIPWVLIQLAHQARTVKFEALDAATLTSRGVISKDDYVGRNSSPAGNSFFQFSWDGTTDTGTQPNGNYVIRLSVLKALGDAGNAAHWETWDSPVVAIARP